MITKEQQEWLDGLSNYPIDIVPYNPRIEKVFEKMKADLQKSIGREMKVIH